MKNIKNTKASETTHEYSSVKNSEVSHNGIASVLKTDESVMSRCGDSTSSTSAVMEEIKQKLINGEVFQVEKSNRFLCFEKDEWIIKRVNVSEKKLETETAYNDFEIALTKLIKR